MDRPHVEELRIQGYGCIQDATFRLTPLHALIGPNDSGKSTVLRALQTLSFMAFKTEVPGGAVRAQNTILQALRASAAAAGPQFEVSASDTGWRVEFNQGGYHYRHVGFERVKRPPSLFDNNDYPRSIGDGWTGPPPWLPRAKPIFDSLRGTEILRLDPEALRAPHALIPDGQPLRFADERGSGLPALYDGIITRNLSAYMELNEELAQLFPSVKSIHLGNASQNTKAIGVRLTDGTVVPAELMSEGMLYYLAFAALPHLDPTALLLVEEPENGLHPARIAEVMRVLRAVSEKTQVLIATHSPLVVNELRPEEVTVVTRSREHGTKATRILDAPNFEERARVYALGELWLSYANGTDEAPLLHGGPRP